MTVRVNDKEIVYLSTCLSELAALCDVPSEKRHAEFDHDYGEFAKSHDSFIAPLIQHDRAEGLRRLSQDRDLLRRLIALVKEKGEVSTKPFSQKWLENGKQVIALFLKDYPDCIIDGFTRAKMLSYYSMGLRQRLDAGPPDRYVQQGFREMTELGFLTKNSANDPVFYASPQLLKELALT